MEPWRRVTALVTVIAFSIQIRPMDSFLTAYLTGPRVGVTLDQVSNVLTPICINVAVIGSLIVAVISDYVRYKPVMIFCTLMGVLSYICLIDSSTLFILKVYQVCYSFITCIDPLYFSYLFAMVKDKDQYQIATGYVTAGTMSGKFVSGILGQLVIYLNDDNYSVLLYYSLACVTFGLMLIFVLPSVERRENSENSRVVDDAAVKPEVFSKEVIRDPNILKYSVENVDPKNIDPGSVIKNPFKRVCEEITHAYTDLQVLRWTLWHAIGIAGYVQIILYINILYTYVSDVSNDRNMLLNGLANSLATMFAAISTYKVGKIHVDWSRYGDMLLAISSLAIALTMYLCYWSTDAVVLYVLYICYYTMIQSVFVISISQIGRQVKNGSYALVLGFSIFTGIVLSMLSSTILTYLKISIPGHFLVYSGTFTAVGIVYGLVASFNKCSTARKFTQLP